MKCVNCGKVKYPYTVEDFKKDRWLNQNDFCVCEGLNI